MANKNNKGSKSGKKKFNIFNVFSNIFVVVFIWYSYETYKFYNKHKTIASKDEKLVFPPDPKIILPAIPCSFIIIVVRKYLIKAFKVIGDKIVRKDKNWPDRDSKVEKCATQIYKTLNYIALSVIGYYLLKDESYFPKSLGGHGDVEEMWKDLPYQNQTKNIYYYYVIALSYHLHSLIDQFKYYGKPSFGDMMLHHIITIGLILFSFFNNYPRIGTLVLFIHDISDICGSLSKITINSKYNFITVISYTGLLSSWIYFRLYVYPFQVIYSAIKQIPVPHHEKNKFLILLMASLVVLHIYWFITFLLIFINYITTNELVNAHEEGFDKLKMNQGKKDNKSKAKSKAKKIKAN
ncbi:LAG1-domain-containing protein [Anaeromyces robustus]|uniref:LAG1-domain-containing protein n=1 Tax=Anaeromyces robustus TaxID=1754192 RepID=A0A1Y1WQL1_9FUNG|nr:LAG1-domain-containing protein [Anaeromyces robustus]|eukprot:ORX75762.1 LAG1-domain-containing protein [Anaeromyces robustus]